MSVSPQPWQGHEVVDLRLTAKNYLRRGDRWKLPWDFTQHLLITWARPSYLLKKYEKPENPEIFQLIFQSVRIIRFTIFLLCLQVCPLYRSYFLPNLIACIPPQLIEAFFSEGMSLDRRNRLRCWGVISQATDGFV